MVTLLSNIDIVVFLFTYLLVYNLSLILFFWVLMSFVSYKLQSLYKLSHLSYNFYTVFILTVLFMSMAGVPPFIGFFSKLFIMVILVSNSFFLVYSLLFIIFFVGLYFYIQNIRFLHSTNLKIITSNFIYHEYVIPTFGYFSFFVIYITCLGMWYIDDLILIWLWILNL